MAQWGRRRLRQPPRAPPARSTPTFDGFGRGHRREAAPAPTFDGFGQPEAAGPGRRGGAASITPGRPVACARPPGAAPAVPGGSWPKPSKVGARPWHSAAASPKPSKVGARPGRIARAGRSRHGIAAQQGRIAGAARGRPGEPQVACGPDSAGAPRRTAGFGEPASRPRGRRRHLGMTDALSCMKRQIDADTRIKVRAIGPGRWESEGAPRYTASTGLLLPPRGSLDPHNHASLNLVQGEPSPQIKRQGRSLLAPPQPAGHLWAQPYAVTFRRSRAPVRYMLNSYSARVS